MKKMFSASIVFGGFCLAMNVAAAQNETKMTKSTSNTSVEKAGNLPEVIQMIANAGAEILSSFDTEFGLKGYIAKTNSQPTIFYTTADGEYAIVGMIMDSKGRNMTAHYLKEKGPKIDLNPIWDKLGKTQYIEEGRGDKLMYVFYEPHCGACAQYYQTTRAYLDRIKIRWIPVSFLSPKSPNVIAALLGAADPSQALANSEANKRQRKSPPTAQTTASIMKIIDNNNKLMREAGVNGTPASLFQDPDGDVHVAHGGLQQKGLDIFAKRTEIMDELAQLKNDKQ